MTGNGNPPYQEGDALMCSICGVTFKRHEHLSRHELSHSNSRPFACNSCGKRFSRSDSLARHVSMHKSIGAHLPGRLAAAHRVSKACVRCAKQRLRCDGREPCGRCVTKGAQCNYVARMKRRLPNSSEANTSGYTSPEGLPNPIQEEAGVLLLAQNLDGSFPDRSQPQRPATRARVGRNDDCFASSTGSGAQVAVGPGASKAKTTSPSFSNTGTPMLESHADDSLHGKSGFPRGPQIRTGVPMDLYTNFSSPSAPATVIPAPCLPVDHRYENQTIMSLGDPGETSLNFSSPAWNCEFSLWDWMLSEPPVTTREIPGPLEEPFSSLHQNPGPVGMAEPWVESSSGSSGGGPPAETQERPKHQGQQWPPVWDPVKSDNVVLFPDMDRVAPDILDAEDYAHVGPITTKCYAEISTSMRRHSNGAGHFRAFSNGNLVSLRTLNIFLQLYFEHFHPTFPILHQATFQTEKAAWQLILSAAAIGCRYSRLPNAAKYADGLQELQRRALADSVEEDNSVVRELWFGQSFVIGSVGMLYSGNRRFFEISEIMRNTPITLVRRSGSLTSTAKPDSAFCSRTPVEKDQLWREWAEEEAKRRLGFAVFIMDSQISLCFNLTPCMSVSELRQSLPACERTWNAITSEEWLHTYTSTNNSRCELMSLAGADTHTVESAIYRIKSGVHPLPTVGEFARLVIVVATYRHSLSLCETVLKNPFLADTAKSAAYTTAELVRGAVAVVEASWKEGLNSHTASNTELRQAVACHTFLALMMLHVPCSELLDFAHSFTIDQERPISEHRLREWIQEDDGRTARSAVAYAGGLFGALQRNPDCVFHSSVSALLAILVLWAYNRLVQKAGLETLNAIHIYPVARHNLERASTVRLDRAGSSAALLSADVQAWLDGRAGLQPSLQGVANICRPSAGLRLVELGMEALGRMRGWGLSQGLLYWLEGLGNRYKKRDEGHC